ncbi:ABC transporter permease [Paenibacillus sp. GCM10012307]|uniref:ABC transporter permease n=1 Tax=Paenibacillus roseus TaxID=2798579 RepID=A0A934MS10_9BACL|nr:ABC transporter permease [Paenibacillus roseus]MBJ6362844.1 ABC transporter permease [Paenibacillus roseus]
MNNFMAVVSFTLRNKMKTKSFIVTTIIIAVILSIGVNLPYIISQFKSEGGATKVGYTLSNLPEVTEPLKTYFDTNEGTNIHLVSYPDQGSQEGNEQVLKQGIKDGEISGYILLEEDAAAGFPKVTYKSESLMESSVTRTLRTGLQAVKVDYVIKDAQLSDAQKNLLLMPVQIEAAQISVMDNTGTGKTVEQQGLAMGFVYAMIIVLFMGIFITSQLIATEITAEKSSRVMEILVTSVAPLKQMFGKITGMSLVGLLQIVVYILVFLINVSLPHNKDLLAGWNLNLGDIDPLLYVYALVFYLTGYFLYSTLCAAVGSMVSRTEDLAQAMMPITMLALAGFYIGIFGMSSPDSMLIKTASFIPFFSPFAMFLRIGLTTPAWWEIVLSLALLAAAIFVLGWISAKIYRTGVLMYGKRPTFKELRKAMKAYKV